MCYNPPTTKIPHDSFFARVDVHRGEVSSEGGRFDFCSPRGGRRKPGRSAMADILRADLDEITLTPTPATRPFRRAT